MRGLQHAANAVRHAETLAEEAEEHGLPSAAAKLRALGAKVARTLDEALSAEERVEPAREARTAAHGALSAAYKQASFQLEAALGVSEAALLTPGSTLDIAERTRFRLRRLSDRAEEHDEETERQLDAVAARLERDIKAYEAAVDAYLCAVARHHAAKDLAVQSSQALRQHLERAKAQLLCRLPAGSEGHQRVRSLTVRTRRTTRALAETIVQGPLRLFSTEEASLA